MHYNSKTDINNCAVDHDQSNFKHSQIFMFVCFMIFNSKSKDWFKLS